MNKVELNQTGGFPLETDTLDFMQTSYTLLQQLAKSIAGNFSCIVSGCQVSGGTTANGTVIINGELLPFIGGATGTNVAIVENVDTRTFRDGITKSVYKDRYATFSAGGPYLWSSFIPVRELVVADSKLKNSIASLGRVDAVNDRDILYGCTVTKSGNSYTHTAGAIYHAGVVYTVDALTTPLVNPNSSNAKWAIDTSSLLISKLKLVPSTSSEGLFEYNNISSSYNARVLSKPIIANHFIGSRLNVGGSGEYTVFLYNTPNDGIRRVYNLNLSSCAVHYTNTIGICALVININGNHSIDGTNYTSSGAYQIAVTNMNGGGSGGWIDNGMHFSGSLNVIVDPSATINMRVKAGGTDVAFWYSNASVYGIFHSKL